jgi:hypothetical protein
MVRIAKDNEAVVLNTLIGWVKEHPRADAAALVYLGREYTPRDILYEVENHTEMGRTLTQFLLDAADRYQVSVESFIERAISANRESISR